MAHSHCTGPGPETGPGTMGLCILLCSVHTTQGHGQGQRQGIGTRTIGFHTHFPIPSLGPSYVPVPGPVQCEWAITRWIFLPLNKCIEKQFNLSLNCLLMGINNLQYYELTRRCSPSAFVAGFTIDLESMLYILSLCIVNVQWCRTSDRCLTSFIVGICWSKKYRSGTLNSNTVNSKFHLIRSFFEIFARFLSFHV